MPRHKEPIFLDAISTDFRLTPRKDGIRFERPPYDLKRALAERVLNAEMNHHPAKPALRWPLFHSSVGGWDLGVD